LDLERGREKKRKFIFKTIKHSCSTYTGWLVVSNISITNMTILLDMVLAFPGSPPCFSQLLTKSGLACSFFQCSCCYTFFFWSSGVVVGGTWFSLMATQVGEQSTRSTNLLKGGNGKATTFESQYNVILHPWNYDIWSLMTGSILTEHVSRIKILLLG